MRFLLDTHVLLWAAVWPERLSRSASDVINDPGSELLFSAVSVWEVAIKKGLNRPDFVVDPLLLRRSLLENAYSELSVIGTHAAAVAILPPLHKDPFDRLLVAQVMVEGITFVTTDPLLARYPALVRVV